MVGVTCQERLLEAACAAPGAATNSVAEPRGDLRMAGSLALRLRKRHPGYAHVQLHQARTGEDGRSAIVMEREGVGRDAAELARLINRNFDLRVEVFEISTENQAMIDTARSVGASAKFAGAAASSPMRMTSM